jgi:hypothetical protein
VVEQGGLAGGLGAEDGDQVVVEAGFGNVAFGEIVIEILSGGIGGNALAERAPEKCRKAVWKTQSGGNTNVKALSSSMIWMPCSYFFEAGPSPTAAKWPFMAWAPVGLMRRWFGEAMPKGKEA